MSFPTMNMDFGLPPSSSNSSSPSNISISPPSGSPSAPQFGADMTAKMPNLQEMLNNIGAGVNLNPLLFQNQLAPPQLAFNPFLRVATPLINQELVHQFIAAMTLAQPIVPNFGVNNPIEERQCKMRRDSQMKKSMSVESTDEMGGMSYESNGDIIVPSSDKEGWCRNKKYIEKTENGFKCAVCNKIYGRYNSVSYHVTIYHRNPPIKCNLQNCQFTTREARYIHFHKYYRHGVPLPQSIDQGSRKCPHCRHVSKSPAMLEKHIRRHQIKDTSAEGSDLLEAVRERTSTICEEPMEVEMEEEIVETKPRSCTL